MINKINNIQIQDLSGKASGQANKNEARPSAGVDITLQSDYASLIEKAKHLPEDDGKVEAARQLLLSGKLESPENILAAAQNIVKFGI